MAKRSMGVERGLSAHNATRRDRPSTHPSTVDAAATAPSTSRVTTLDHEVIDDTMKDQVVVIAGLGQLPEVLAGLRSVIPVELKGERALRGLKCDTAPCRVGYHDGRDLPL